MATGSNNTTILADGAARILINPDYGAAQTVRKDVLSLIQELAGNPAETNSQRIVDGVFTAVHQIKDDLFVITTISEKSVYAVINRTTYRIILVSLAVLFIAIILIRIFSNSITNPIKELVDASAKIERGEFELDIQPRTQDEIGLLTASFVQMGKGLSEREKLMVSFSKFTNKTIAQKAASGELSLGGENRTATIFFSDIRSFTAMSEKMQPHEVVEFLNAYMTRMVDCVNKTGGVVDKYIGDAVMALFESADAAVEAGIEIYRSIVLDSETAQRLKVSEINIGIGIHTGMAEIGIVGEEERLSGTVISDTVNLSSRLESLTKTYKTAMLISKDTLDHMKASDTLDLRYLGMVQVAGVNEVRSLYEVLDCLPDEERQLRSASKSEFREALRLFHMGERGKAIQRLQALVDSGSDDHITKMYLQYMQELSPDDKGKVFVFVRK